MWNKDFTVAPRDKQILVRHQDWPCPVVVEWDHTIGAFIYSDDMIAATDPDSDLTTNTEWTSIPE